MEPNDLKRKELEQKILSKRQQIEFERAEISVTSALDSDNRENPDVMEDTKNFDDPAETVVETADLKSLKTAEKELDELISQLAKLNESSPPLAKE
jgi:hypothetical protein